MENSQWHALLVRRGFERIVAYYLSAQKIENYLPTLPESRQPAENTDWIESPLFPGCVFCKCDVTGSLWKIPGVLSLVQGGNETEVLSEREINTLRRILAAGLQVQRWPFTSQAGKVMIAEGRLKGVTGILEAKADGPVFVFSIPLIRQSFALRLDAMPREEVTILSVAGESDVC